MKYSISENTGYTLATIEQPTSKTVVAYISADLHDERTAKSRAIELLYTDSLLSGAGKYSREQFLDAINSLGATVSASISDGVLTIFIRSKADVFSKILKLVETMLKEPHFSATEQKRIKQTVINAIKESKEDSRAIAHEQLRNAFYGIHDRRYTHDEDTIIKTIATVTPKDLQKLHKHALGLRWTCSIAGNKTSIATFQKTLSTTNKVTKSGPSEFGIHQQKPPQPGHVVKDIPSRQNIDFSIGAPIPITLHHPDFLPLMFGLTVLAKWGGFSGRLMSTVREEEGLTYMIYGRTESFMNEEQGYWRIVTFFSPKDAVKGLTSTFREIKKIHNDGITKEELTKFKQILHTSHVLKNDSTQSLLGELHAYHLQKFSLAEIEEHKKRLLSVTIEEVNAVLKRYLDVKTLTISAAGPLQTVKKDLQAFVKTVS
ncbi:MAG: hypothetical protein RLZZ480_183 [Candidatus Parcubacteria bacterium]|jgi:zinc protease